MPQAAPLRNSQRAGMASQGKIIGQEPGGLTPNSPSVGTSQRTGLLKQWATYPDRWEPSVRGRTTNARVRRHRREAILDTVTGGPVNGPLLRTPAGSPAPAGR